MTGSIFDEEPDGGRTTRTAVEPGSEGGRGGTISSFEEPEPPTCCQEMSEKGESRRGPYMFMFVPTDKYPEYWFTPGVVSQMPELVTNSSLAPVAACSNTV